MFKTNEVPSFGANGARCALFLSPDLGERERKQDLTIEKKRTET